MMLPGICMSKRIVPPARRAALFEEAYRIGMQQVLPEIEGFADTIVEREVVHFLEIGSNRGGLSFLLAHLTPNGLRIILDNAGSRARTQMLSGLPGEVHEIVADSHREETVSEVEDRLKGRKVDLLFIDGDHSYEGVKRDYFLYRHLVRPGGMIAFHDIRDSEYTLCQGIESPRFWAELSAEPGADSVQEFLAAPDECALPSGNWEWSVNYAHEKGIPGLWGGIGVLFTPGPTGPVTGSVINAGDSAPGLEHTARRSFLVYCPTNAGDFLAELDNPKRLFDVALNDFSGSGTGIEIAEWKFAERTHKWRGIAVNLEKIGDGYDYIAFIDNDITLSTEQLNTLFLTASALRLDLFQASLTEDSCTAWAELKQRNDSYVRAVRLVEIMMPIFSRRGLAACRETFGMSTTGWGLDLVWTKILKRRAMAVCDAVVAGHRRPVGSHLWRNEQGMDAREEMREVCSRFGIV
jgi:hypothetical protein